MDNITQIDGFSSAGAEKIRQMTGNPELYTQFLKFQGRVFKHSTSVALEFFAQNPDAKFIATRQQWNKLRYTMQAGESGIWFADKNGHRAEFFDLSQMEIQKQPYVWTLNKKNAVAVKAELGISQKESILEVINQTDMPELNACMEALQIPPQEREYFKKPFTEAVRTIVAGRLEMNGSNFNISSNPDFFKSLKSDEERLLFLSYATKTARTALMKIEKAVNDISSRNRAGLLPETEQEKRDNLEDLQELVRISVAITMKEKEFTALFHQTEHKDDKPYDKMSEISKEISDLKLEYRTLSQKIKNQNITAEDIAMLRNIYPKRTSVQNLPEYEIARTAKFQNLLDEELGEKSPYRMRQTDNKWREDEEKKIPVITVAKRDVSNVRKDVKNGIVERGNFINKDTGITINYGSMGINDSFAHAVRRQKQNSEVEFSALYQMRDLIENAVQFDTQLSDSKKKSHNSLFMHKLYAVFQYDDNYYLANLTVDESYRTDKSENFEGTSNKLYNAKSIKITPIGDLGFTLGTRSETSEHGEPTSVTEISIPQLYEIVKTYDKNFFENPQAPNREEREAEIYAHAQYVDANNALKDKEHHYTPVETEKQVSRIAESHGKTKSETVSMLEKIVHVYSRFPADNATSEDISANFDVEFAEKVQAAFDEVAQNQKLSPRQQEFMDALKDFAVTNHVSNDLINKALAECSRFQSQYTDRKWISQNIFYGRLGRTETELQNALKKHLPSLEIHDAFRKVIKEQQLSDDAKAVLKLAENQMRKNHFTTLAPVVFSMPEFRDYGTRQEIDENLFDGKLKEIITEINKNLSSEKQEEIKESVNSAPEQTAPVSSIPETSEPEETVVNDEFSEEHLHQAFERLLENHDFPDNTKKLLERIEKQMNITRASTFNPELLISPAFAHHYGGLHRINQNFFDGNLTNIIDEINQNLSEKLETVEVLDEKQSENEQVSENTNSESNQAEEDILQKNQQVIDTIEVGDEITLHGNSFVVQSVSGNFMMSMDAKNPQNGEVVTRQFIGDWKKDLLAETGNELIFVRKQSEIQSETIPDEKFVEQKKYPYVSVKGGWNYNYMSPELEEKDYTVPEFNEALKKLNERWDNPEYDTRTAYVTLTIHLSETESHEKRLNAEYQFESLLQRLEYDGDLFEYDEKLQKAVREIENPSPIIPEEKQEQQEVFAPVPEVSGEQMTLFEEPKNYQVVTYDNDSGADDKKDFFNLNDAVEEGRQYLAEGYAGFAILNKEEHKIELYEGDFPESGIFSEEVYKNSGMWEKIHDIDSLSGEESITWRKNEPNISLMSDFPEVPEIPVQEEPEEITLEFTGSPEKLSAIKDKALFLGAVVSENFENHSLTVSTYENHREEIQNTADEFSDAETTGQSLPKIGDIISWKSPASWYKVENISDDKIFLQAVQSPVNFADYTIRVPLDEFIREGFKQVKQSADKTEESTQTAQAQEKHRKNRSERLYEKFAELFPKVVSGEHTYERYGNYDENGGVEPVSVEHLGGETYGMMSYYIQNGDVMRDPDFTFNLKKEAKRLEILEYQQDGVPALGTLYQHVYDENGNPDIRLQNELEKNLEQVLKSVESMRKPLSEYEDREGNRVKIPDAEEPEIDEEYQETEEFPEEINPDKTPHLREILNQFSQKHGLGELNVENDGDYGRVWRLKETLRDGTIQTLGMIDSPDFGMPFTPESLQKSLESLEKSAETRGQKISEMFGRQEAVANHGGISELPKVQKNLPEITYAKSPAQKISDNLSAIREMIRLERAEENGDDLYDPRSNQYNSRQNSEDRLRRYSGWGGLPQLFDESFHQFDYYRNDLKKLLTEEEYANARASTLNAHYTPQVIIDAMYKAVQNMDLPRDARILEPSCGTGNFISRMPHSLGDAEVVGIELDGITARIAKQLHRNSDNVQIIQTGFEHSGLENNSFDLAVGNVPFGDYNLNDPDYADNWRIHDAFFRKALDKVAPGGVVAFVTSCGTMDKKNPKVREYLAERAELVGAVRLPENAFSSAGTKTPTDIIFLKKRETPLKFEDKKPDWCYTVSDPNGSGLNINAYFAQNPQMVLGKIEKSSFQGRMTCVPFPDADLKLQLDEAIKNLNAKIAVSKREKAFAERQGKIEPWGKNFAFHVKDDKVYYRQGDSMNEVECTDSERKQIAMLCELRTSARNLIAMQKTAVNDEDLIPLRQELNQKYDAYKKEFGAISSDKKLQKLFGTDSDYPILLSLEQKKGNKLEKADIFTKRTVNATVEITSVKTLDEALQVSLDQKGKPDIPYMAMLLSDAYQMPLSERTERICNELLEQGHIFIDPEKNLPDKPYSGVVERSEYLSGNVRMKLLFAEEHAKMNLEYQRNVDALKQVIPEDIKAEEISVRMGCTWIDTEDYTAFLQHLSGRNQYDQRCNVMYSPATGEYEIMNARSQTDLNQNETVTYGTSDYNMYELAQKVLNQRRIVVKKEVPDPNDKSKTITRTDPKATKIALEKSKAIQKEFADWIFSSPERKEKYERRYNDIFNSLVGRDYDGSHLTFSGLANDFTLRPHQKNCVARAVYGGNTLAAHVVGAGKSAVMFTSVMKKKELGLINKACVVVPKALTEQTANEWRRLYPDAKILTVTNEDLSTEARRNLFTARVATGSYDAVVMSQEQFEKIPMSKDYRIKFMQREIDSLADALREKKIESNGRRDYSVKKIEKAKKQLETKLDNLLNPKGKAKEKDNLLEFEQLGFDFLVCDEAHAYKNGFVTTKMTNVAGVTTRPSGRAEDMQMKTDYFNQNLGQGHILFCTGTPVSNSMTELYVMTRYLRPDLLMQAGVSRFDDWAATFGNVVMKNQQSADGTLKLKTCFAKFANLPELMAMYKEFADIQSAEKLQLPRPALKDGKPTIVKVPASPEQKAYVMELADRARLISEGRVDSSDDNLLKITGEARQIGLGNQAIAALYRKRGEELPEGFQIAKDSKVDKCVENVAEIYHEKKEENKTAVQIIFSDIAVNSDNGNFSVYDYIKKELIAKGIPEDEIIFAPKADAKNREAIFKAINEGKYKVVIASTGTLGTGANIQQNLYALHHVDIPWKPSDFEQREGRILRQGNNFDEVQIFNYVTEGTLDSYLYQTVTDKARFIAQLMDDKCPARVSEDCDEKVLTFGEIQAAAEGNPDFRRRIELGNEIEELKMFKREHIHETSVMKQRIQEIPDEIAEKQQVLEKIRQDKSSAESMQDFKLETESGTVLKEKKDMNTHLLGMVQKMMNNPAQTSPKAKIGNFNLSVFVSAARDKIKFLLKGEHGYNCDAGINEHQDNVQRLQNLLTKIIPKREEETVHEIENLQLNLKQAEAQVAQEFPREQELQDALQEFQKLEERLAGLSEQTDSVYDPEDIADPVIETKEEKAERESLYSADKNDYQPTEEDDLNQFPHIRK